MATASLALAQGAFVVDHDWVATGGLAIGQQGVIHIATGAAIAAYDADGVQLWHRPGEGVQNVAVDRQGNTYGVGAGILVKLDAGGTVQWAVAPEGQVRSVATDAEGHIYLAGYRDGLSGGQARPEDMIIAKYDTDGQRLWQFSITNVLGRCRYPCHRTQEPSIAVDANGMLHVVGYFTGTIDVDPGVSVKALDAGASMDVFVARYDADGQYLNAFRVGGDPQGQNKAMISP
ncbi:MAG: hypothetical protein AAGJ10_07365 [Bacteroidota bacterium]